MSWKVVAEYPKYMISESGEVKSFHLGKEKILTHRIKNGYHYIGLSKGNGGRERKMLFIHRLVAMTFLSNSKKLSQVNHIDGNKSNNHVNNLEWCTPAYNTQHAYDTGLKVTPKGEDVHNSTLTEETARDIFKILKGASSYSEVEKKYNISKAVIASLVNGKTWKHLNLKLDRKKDCLACGVDISDKHMRATTCSKKCNSRYQYLKKKGEL